MPAVSNSPQTKRESKRGKDCNSDTSLKRAFPHPTPVFIESDINAGILQGAHKRSHLAINITYGGLPDPEGKTAWCMW